MIVQAPWLQPAAVIRAGSTSSRPASQSRAAIRSAARARPCRRRPVHTVNCAAVRPIPRWAKLSTITASTPAALSAFA